MSGGVVAWAGALLELEYRFVMFRKLVHRIRSFERCSNLIQIRFGDLKRHVPDLDQLERPFECLMMKAEQLRESQKDHVTFDDPLVEKAYRKCEEMKEMFYNYKDSEIAPHEIPNERLSVGNAPIASMHREKCGFAKEKCIINIK